MKNNRREFIKRSGFAGLGIIGTVGCARSAATQDPFPVTHKQSFNMSGYIAPKLEQVRVGIIGLGNRGSGTVRRLASIQGVEIKALCDLEPDRVSKAKESISYLGQNPDSYSGHEDEWKKVCERKDIDLIAVVTPWHLHTPMCVYAMEHEKHSYTELPAAISVEECWQLVETSERTKKHCIQMSSNCHTGLSAVLLNMVREGFFGDIIHGEGAYIHDLLLRYNFSKTMYHNMWRLKANINKHGSLYPQHGLMPVLQMMDINYGDKLDFLVSVSSNDYLMGPTAEKMAAEDDFWKPYVGKNFRGNMNTTVIRTNKGRTIMIQHDVSSPRPDVRFSMISGTKGIYQSGPPRIAKSHDGWLPEDEFKAIVQQYTPEITKRFGELSAQAQSINPRGRSYDRVSPTDWRIIDCLKNGLPMDIDVYDAAVSTSIIPLSVWSVANGSMPVNVPDFTSGAWKTNQRGMDINLTRGGGNTGLI